MLVDKIIEKLLIIFLRINLINLNEKEKIDYIKETIRIKFDLKEELPEEFYQYQLNKINNKDYRIFRYNTINELIDEYKQDSLYVKGLEHFISYNQYIKISFKYIRQIRALLKEKLDKCRENQLDDLYKEELQYKLSRQTQFLEDECTILAYLMYISIGLNNSINLLKDKYGEISFKTVGYFFYSMFLKNVEINNKLPIINEAYLHFIFGDNPNNSLMQEILSGKYRQIYLNFAFLYHNFSRYQQTFKGKLTKKRIEELLSERYLKDNPFYPEFSSDVVGDIVISNKNLDCSAKDVKKEYYAYYDENMAKQYKSSISQMHFKYDEYYLDILAKSDPLNLVMGYRTNNCFRLNGEASILFMKALKSKHYRIISISTTQEENVAMVLLARNGNCLIIQGIEISKSHQNYESQKEIYEVLKKTMKDLMDYMNASSDEINAVVIGCSNKFVSEFNQNLLPFRVPPIKDNEFQYYYDGFHFPQCLLHLRDNESINSIQLYEPLKEYLDDRQEILYWANEYPYDSLTKSFINQRLFAISCKCNTQQKRIAKCMNKEIKEIYCNVDWYLIVFIDGDTEGTYLEYDYRAKEEYDLYLSKVNGEYLRLKK